MTNRFTRRRFLRDSALTGALLANRAWARATPEDGAEAHPEYKMFFAQPAAAWPDALPVGNGRLGGMVFGHPQHERIQLNEETIWDGERRDRNNPGASVT